MAAYHCIDHGAHYGDHTRDWPEAIREDGKRLGIPIPHGSLTVATDEVLRQRYTHDA